MIELLVLRHGQSTADLEDRHEGRADYPLTELGRQQAALAAEWIAANYPVKRIYASPLKRAAETAELVAAKQQLTVEYDPNLMEMDNGYLAGMLRAEAEIKYPKPAKRQLHEPLPGGENALQFRLRVEHAWWKIISEAHDLERIAIVSHGGTISMLYQSFLNLPIDTEVAFSTTDTGIHLWRVDGDRRIVRFANYREHLQGLEKL